MAPEPESGNSDSVWVRDQIQKNDAARFEQRVARAQRVQVQKIIPHLWFDAPLAECGDMFRDGHFYGCICLSQSVAEGLAKFVLEVHHVTIGKQKRPIALCKTPVTGKRLIRLLRGLNKGVVKEQPMDILSEKCIQAFVRIEGGDRDDFHHLNKDIITDFDKLEKRAEECVKALYVIESELFGVDLDSGSFAPHQVQYWRQVMREKYATVYLRFGF